MSNNRKTASVAKKLRNKKAVKKDAKVKGIYPQMYIGATGVCCKLNILKKRFVQALLDADDINGYVAVYLFPMENISKTGNTHFVIIRNDADYVTEQEIVAKRIKELGL